jgi:hypothetical protein
MHDMPKAFCLDLLKAGNSIAAKMAIIAITTNNSIKVNAFLLPELPHKFPALLFAKGAGPLFKFDFAHIFLQILLLLLLNSLRDRRSTQAWVLPRSLSMLITCGW